jgi:hypothetical protein
MDKFLKILDTGQNLNAHPTCFYLCWEKNTAEWCNADDHKDAVFRTYVKWPAFKRDILIASDEPSSGSAAIVDHKNLKNISYLKSHLQKSVRLSNTYRAILTACEFIEHDMSMFLRRILIIAIEDALPLEGYEVLTWFMSAHSKGYILNTDQIRWCLKYVYDLAKCSHYEQVNPISSNTFIKNLRLPVLPVEGKTLIYSILFRETYGGLKHDMELCQNIAVLWSARFHTKSLHLSLLKRETGYMTYASRGLALRDWYLSAIDFHTSPSLITFIREKYDHYSELEIKLTIWHLSSSRTNKKNIGTDYQLRNNQLYIGIWKEIKKSVQAYSWHIISGL